MNLHALRLFYTVAEEGNVTCAAKKLNISQPAVTAQIKKLEKEIGLTLLSPRGRGIYLTQTGLQLAKQAKRLFSLQNEIESYLEHLKEGSVGKLHIVATSLPANFLLPKWISRFKGEYPDVDVEITTVNSTEAISQLVNYKADIGIIGGNRTFNKHISSTLLLEDEMVFISNNKHKYAEQTTTLAEIVKEPFVFREEGSFSRELLLSLCNLFNVNKPCTGLQMNGLNETINTVIEGYGITFVSFLEVNRYISRGDVKRINVEHVDVTNPISLCWRNDDVISTSAFNFIELIRKEKME
ncbi:LysR family transcriptional regulator [Bacillus spizizenii]|nr:LysR family transcriptional regulator [Bacillus spizizenii]